MEASRYQLVDLLYGPGTVGAWLLTLCAVIISWTMNKNTRRKDSISLDFVGAVLLPLVASWQLFFQVARLPFSIAKTITSRDVEIQQYASALEAPLNICETFEVVALIAAASCGPWWKSDPKYRRLSTLLVAGLLSCGTENIMFAMATFNGVKIDDVTLSRPYFFLITPIVAATWVFLLFCVLCRGVVWILSIIHIKKSQKPVEDLKREAVWPQRYHASTKRLKVAEHNTRDEVTKFRTADLDDFKQGSSREARSMRAMSILTVLFIPALFSASLFSMPLPFVSPETTTVAYTPRAKSSQSFFLIPKSNGSLNSLDQIIALVTGVLTLGWAIQAAYLSRMDILETSKSALTRRRSI